MRKYRGKTKDGKWVEGFHFQAYNDIGQEVRLVDYIIEPHIFVLKAENMMSENRLAIVGFTEVIPESVGQDAGLKDKNDKPIWENDEVISLDGLRKYKVVYSEKFGRWILEGLGRAWNDPDPQWFEYEVIGPAFEEESQ